MNIDCATKLFAEERGEIELDITRACHIQRVAAVRLEHRRGGARRGPRVELARAVGDVEVDLAVELLSADSNRRLPM